MNAKKLNNSFFSAETPSKQFYYVLGTFYASASKYKEGFEFHNVSLELVENVNALLGSNYVIGHDKREGKNLHWIRAGHSYDLSRALESMGVIVPYSQREFPSPSPGFADHFVRGLFDAKGIAGSFSRSPESNYVRFGFNHGFSKDLNALLAREAGTKKVNPKNKLEYGHIDSLKIHDFIYRDWEYIQEHKLYLPPKKELFKIENRLLVRPYSISSKKRVERAAELLLSGKKPLEAAVAVGYQRLSSLSGMFMVHKGKTIRQFLKDSATKSS